MKIGWSWKELFFGTLLILSSGPLTKVQSLHEDQVGKFDWHQKLIGPIRFLFNDPHQPKRILVGAENNVIGAVHGNTGNILYRQLLEQQGKLIYYGLYEERQTLVVSQQPEGTGSFVKVRSFVAPTGIKVDEWVTKLEGPNSKLTHVTEYKSKVYLISAPEAEESNEVLITVLKLTSGGSKGSAEEASKVETKKVKLNGSGTGSCAVTGAYFVCGKGNVLSVLNLDDGSVSTKKMEDGDVQEVLASGQGPISAISVTFQSITRAYILLENSKSGAELLPLNIPSSSPGRILLSQYQTEERPLLFLSQLNSPNSLSLSAYTRNGQLVPDSVQKIKASMPLSPLRIGQGFYLNSNYGFVGVTKDELLFGTKADYEPSSGKAGKEIEWSREESLTSIVGVEMVDYPSEVGPTWNPYLATLNVFSAFVSRVKYEIEAIITGESLYSSSEDRFGLRKVIVFATAVGKVVGMDGSTGNVLYTFYLPDFSLFKETSAFLFIQRPAKYTPLKPQAVLVYKSDKTGNTVVFAFNPVEGKPLDEPRIFPPAVQTQMVHHANEETKYIKPILILDKSRNVHVYPDIKLEEAAVAEMIKGLHFLVANKGPVLQGFDVRGVKGNALKANLLWELPVGGSELLGVYGKLQTERVHSQGRVLPDRSVSYKYMNPNLVVVVTSETEQGNINLFLVDAVSGSLLHSFWHKKCRGPVHVVHSEHWLVYSLYSEKNRRWEVNSVELYEGQKQSNSSAFSSFAAPPVEPIVVKQSYIFPTSIQHLAHTRSEKGITNKDILIGLPSGGILELPRIILQPRLTQVHYTQQVHTDEDGVVHSIPYVPELPMPSEMIFNYNQTVRRVDGIKTWPTRLESTCLVLVHGSDLYYSKLTPSKTFDVLKDDFDHLFILVVLFGLILAAYLTKRLAARKLLDQAWK